MRFGDVVRLEFEHQRRGTGGLIWNLHFAMGII